jgi:hypothetical protein
LGAGSSTDDAPSDRPSTVTYVEGKEQINQRIRENRKMSVNGIIPETRNKAYISVGP